jgi:disulfide oxidoreductase YuzD
LVVKEEIDRLLEAGFIYPVNNSEWVSPVVVVPKKVGADGKVKIRVVTSCDNIVLTSESV